MDSAWYLYILIYKNHISMMKSRLIAVHMSVNQIVIELIKVNLQINLFIITIYIWNKTCNQNMKKYWIWLRIKLKIWHSRNHGNMETLYNHKILRVAKMFTTAQMKNYYGWILHRNMLSFWDLPMKQGKYI